MTTREQIEKLKAKVFDVDTLRIFPEESVRFFLLTPVAAWKQAIRDGKVPHTSEVIAKLKKSLYDDERALADALEKVLNEMENE